MGRVLSLWVALGMILVGGCASRGQVAVRHGPVTNVVLCHSVSWCVPLWDIEAQKRFRDPVVVFGHGGDRFGGWTVMCELPDGAIPVPVEWVVMWVQSQYPGRPLVLVICNPCHEVIQDRDVWYAPRDVWLMPRSFYFAGTRDEGEGVGDIGEFVGRP